MAVLRKGSLTSNGTIWSDSQGVRHYVDVNGWCNVHQHIVAHDADCDYVDHPGRTCDEAGVDRAMEE